jgi:biopolymer transport protein ExbD
MRVNLNDEEGADVQMAPLVDCVFLLLIFFLVATTLKKIDRELPLDLPDVAAAIDVQQPDNFTVISVDRASGLYVDGTPVSLGLLQADLRAKARVDRDIKVRLDVDRHAEFQHAMQVLDILRFEGLKNVSINSKRDSQAN